MKRSIGPGRRGAALALMSVLTVVVLGMTAFAIDIGYIAYVKGRLQNAADAAALAGAEKLMQPYLQWSYPNVTAVQQAQILSTAQQAAMAEAVRFAGLNGDGQVSSLTLLNSDISFGFLDQTNTFSPTPPDAHFPNTVVVTLRRDGQANGPLPLFFGAILGKATSTMTVTARATTYSNVSTFRSPPAGYQGSMLPVQLDVHVWEQFLANGTSSNANNQVFTGPNGALEMQVYPDNTGQGHFGLVDIGPPANDVPAFRTWIANGPSAGDLQYLLDNKLLPVSMDAPQAWKAGPGMKSTLQTDFAAIIGRPSLLPLSDGSGGGGGSNGTFNIVGFAGVTISEAYGHGNNMVIAVQPMVVVDPMASGGVPTGSLPTSGTAPPPTYSFQAPRLTQ